MKCSTAFMLLYGDYHALHCRALEPLLAQPADRIDVRLWLNVVCSDTAAWVAEHAPPEWLVYVLDRNVPKYRAMASLFNDPAHPIETPWITWFDDDSIVTNADWLDKTWEFITCHPNVALFGRECRKRHMSGVENWISKAGWYRKRAFQKVASKVRGIRFIQGCYWWLLRAVQLQLRWPDPRLNHNGGDTALSEALWQNQLDQANFTYGVAVDTENRRGFTERPAGATNERAHRSDNSTASMAGAVSRYMSIFEKATCDTVMIVGKGAKLPGRIFTPPAAPVKVHKPKAKSVARPVTARYLTPSPLPRKRVIGPVKRKKKPRVVATGQTQKPRARSLKQLLEERNTKIGRRQSKRS